jgi:hypothetical protein
MPKQVIDSFNYLARILINAMERRYQVLRHFAMAESAMEIVSRLVANRPEGGCLGLALRIRRQLHLPIRDAVRHRS